MAVADTPVSFGKHRGRTFAQVASADAGYCEWVLKLESPNGQLKDFAEFLRARTGHAQTSNSGPAVPAASSGAPCPATVDARGYSMPPARLGVNQAPGTVKHLNTPTSGIGINQVPGLSILNGPRLGDDSILACELLQQTRQFVVRVERNPRAAGPASAGAAVYFPPHIWKAVSSLTSATLSADRRSWLFPLSCHGDVVTSLAKFGKVDPIPKWVFGLLEESARHKQGELDVARLPPKLLPYQLEGVRFGVGRNGRCLIGDEMGLGKTLQALAIAAQYREELPVLVVCPSSLRWVWKQQAEEWLPELVHADDVQVITKGADNFRRNAKFWIISYNLLATDAKKGKFQARPDGSPHQMVIADESHNIKEWSAARTKAVVAILKTAKRAILLSGTPTRNTADELHPQLSSLLPCLASFAEFRSRYCVQQQTQIFSGKVVSRVVGARNTTELNSLLNSTVMVRRLKKDVLSQLPPKRRQKIPIEVSDEKVLREIRSEMQTLSDLMSSGGGGEAVQTLFLKTAKAKLPAVKEYLLEVLERGDEKTIIFAHHQIVLDGISQSLGEQLRRRGLSYIRIDGHTPGAHRPELVKCFQEDEKCRVALLSITACGEGLTLTAAGLVIFAELFWVPGAVEQAEARAHRIGSSHSKVIVEFLVVPNSPDERIFRSLERKTKDTSCVLDGTSKSLEAEMHERHAARRKRKLPTEAVEDMASQESVASAASVASASGVQQNRSSLDFWIKQLG